MRSLIGWAAVLLLSANARAATGDMRLIDAVKAADTKAVKSLLAQHAGVNTAEPDGSTALLWAAQRDSVDIADLLIGAGANVNAATRYGVTPLRMACGNGNAAIVEHLLKAGADANMKFLVEHGAQVDARNKPGWTPLMVAEGVFVTNTRHEYPEAAAYLRNR